MKKSNILLNPLIKNTIILIICSLLIKILSLGNRVLLTRLMGNDGISLYIMALPTISLAMSIAGFSLNVALSKIVSENLVTKRYSNRAILIKATLIGLISSLLMILIVLLSTRILVDDLLKQPALYYPIIACCLFLPLVAINNIVRGYYNGLNKLNISAYISVVEQIVRIIFSIIFIVVFANFGLIWTVTATILAMGCGEFFSLLFSLFMLKKHNFTKEKTNTDPTKEIVSIAMPTTLSRLVGNFSYFLEPIIFTFALGLIHFSNNEIMYKYSEVTAYALPLITMFTFISTSIATAIIPNIAKYFVQGDKNYVEQLTKKAILLSLIPGIFITLILTIYSDEAMNLIYSTDIGAEYVRCFSCLFIISYIQPPLVATLQALGKAKTIFKISLLTNITKLLLIISLVFIPEVSYHSLMIANILTMMLGTLLCYFIVKNTISFKFSFQEITKLIAIFAFTLFSILFYRSLITNFIIAVLLSGITFIMICKIFAIKLRQQ